MEFTKKRNHILVLKLDESFYTKTKRRQGNIYTKTTFMLPKVFNYNNAFNKCLLNPYAKEISAFCKHFNP